MKDNWKISCLLCFALAVVSLCLVLFGGGSALAEDWILSQTEEEEYVFTTQADNSDRYTNVSFSINGGDGAIWVTAKHEASLFNPTVSVIVELYWSETYQESYTNMCFLGGYSQKVFAVGEKLMFTAPTNAEGYWQGRLRYKVNGGRWKNLTTTTCHYSATGQFLGYI